MAKIVILGAGVMGTAFSVPLADAGQEVNLVGTHLDNQLIDQIRKTGRHPKILSRLPESLGTFYHNDLTHALGVNTDLIVLGVSSPGVQWAIKKLGPLMNRPIPVLMLTKGLAISEHGSVTILPHIVSEGLEKYGLRNVPVGGVGGPCIAGELAARRDTSVDVSFRDRELRDWLLKTITTPYYHVCPSADLIGLETCAALKNLYALAVGYSRGLLEREGGASDGILMHNVASGLFTQALFEIASFVRYMNGTSSSVYGLAGAGDFYVTCQAGRNSRMGYLLGLGLRYSEAKERHMADDTIEGADLALLLGPQIEELMDDGELDRDMFPLAMAVIKAICHNEQMTIPWKSFYRSSRVEKALSH